MFSNVARMEDIACNDYHGSELVQASNKQFIVRVGTMVVGDFDLSTMYDHKACKETIVISHIDLVNSRALLMTIEVAKQVAETCGGKVNQTMGTPTTGTPK